MDGNARRTAKRILDGDDAAAEIVDFGGVTEWRCPACELPGGGRCPECMGPINDQANVFPEPHIGDDYSVSKAEPGV